MSERMLRKEIASVYAGLLGPVPGYRETRVTACAQYDQRQNYFARLHFTLRDLFMT
jgi:hypothetical protein